MAQHKATSSPSLKRKEGPESGNPLPSEQDVRRKKRAAFFDNLSQLWLTPRTLREFDRRTTHTVPPRRPDAAIVKDFVQSLRLSSYTVAKDPPAHPHVIPKVARSCASHTSGSSVGTSWAEILKRCARRGGTDLSDLRGVGSPVQLLGYLAERA